MNKRIKNIVIEEAVRLGELRQVFHPKDHGEDALPEQLAQTMAVGGVRLLQKQKFFLSLL